MVLATCRGILKDPHAAEDAFQATFLTLARKAGSLRSGNALAGWLHRVARRVSVEANIAAARRRGREVTGLTSDPLDRRSASPRDEDWPILHEELDRLPERYRAPIVLCYLEGMTCEQAAGHLRWPVGTVGGRLARARELMRGRLIRRGVTASLAGLASAPMVARAAVPESWGRAAVAAATGGTASAASTLLSDILLRGMLMTKFKFASTAALSILALAVGGLVAAATGRPEAPNLEQAPGPESVKLKAEETIRVVDPDGKPARGAKVYRSDTRFRSMDHDPMTASFLAETGPDGSFRLSPDVAKAAMDRQEQVLATAEGSGPAFADPSVGDGMKLLRLARDDVPIRGRVLDVEGRPVAGASVQVVSILWHPSGKLDEWLDALKAEQVAFPVQYRLLRWWSSDDVPSLYPAVKTDSQGRFTLKGIGRERVVSLLINGPGIETRYEYAATRDMPAAKYPDFDRQNQAHQVTYYGASFDLVAGPGLEVVGTVRDKDTGRPIPGASVQTTGAFGNPLRFLRTTADAEGRYRLSGVTPKNDYGEAQKLLASVKGGPAYLQSVQSVGEGRGVVSKDFELKRGVWARGRVTDQATGQPVQANLSYYILEDNPHLKDYPRYDTVNVGDPFRAGEDGAFEIVVMPGRGILGARFGNETYRLGVGIEKIQGLKMEGKGLFATRPHYLVPVNYNTLVEVNPKEGDESVKADIALDRGRTVKGTLVGPGGEPVEGALIMGAEDYFQSWSDAPLPSAEFEVHALGPDSKRGLLFFHEGKKLAGSYLVRPGESGPVTIKLEPCGTLTGRLVDDEGRPRPGAQMTCDGIFIGDDSRFEKGSLPAPIKTDEDGRFRTSGLVPGLKYSLRVWKGRMITGEAVKDVVAAPGEVKDLGDVRVPPPGKPDN
jgi:RNA polymerase sigma factor (sigma-70 family)